MEVTYFDSQEPFLRAGTADVDRVYRLSWRHFGDAEWDALGKIYQRMPGWLGYHPGPCWFGKDERTAPHLTASVEPPGLQVTGRLGAADFGVWHERFLAAVQRLPALEPD